MDDNTSAPQSDSNNPIQPASMVMSPIATMPQQPTVKKPWRKSFLILGVLLLVALGAYAGIRIFTHPKFKTITYNNRFDTIAQLQFYSKYSESNEPSGSQSLISKEPAIGYLPLTFEIDHEVDAAEQSELTNCSLPQSQGVDPGKTLYVKNNSTGSVVKLCAISSNTGYQSMAINGYQGLFKFGGVNYEISIGYDATAQQNASKQTTDIQAYKGDIATIVSSLKIISRTPPTYGSITAASVTASSKPGWNTFKSHVSSVQFMYPSSWQLTTPQKLPSAPAWDLQAVSLKGPNNFSMYLDITKNHTTGAYPNCGAYYDAPPTQLNSSYDLVMEGGSSKSIYSIYLVSAQNTAALSRGTLGCTLGNYPNALGATESYYFSGQYDDGYNETGTLNYQYPSQSTFMSQPEIVTAQEIFSSFKP